MAGDWIKMRVDLVTDPAVIGIAASLDCTEFEVVGMLHHFWSWVDAQSRDGHAASVTKSWIDRYVQRVGFANQLEKVGWLVAENDGISIPNFERHNGQSAKKRAVDGKRQKTHRENMSREPSRNERDKSVTREEKRREEIEDKPPCIPPAGEAKAKRAPKAGPKTRLPDPFMLTGEMKQWAAERVPLVDVRLQTERFVNYWRAEGKTKADWPATWRNWLLKEQESAERQPRRGYLSEPVNRQQQIEDANNRVVQEILEQENRRQHRHDSQGVIDLGAPITLEGEVI